MSAGDGAAELRFPDGFVWGAATSAAQIEGGSDVDGRGRSIWDTFAARPGTIADGSDPSVADDHRRLMRRDVAMMAALGLPAYRFSVAWPRVQPTGQGEVSSAGLDFYRELVDTLLDAGIEPVVTLYHWDLPQALQDAGGWQTRSTAERFGRYASVVGEALGDRVRRWTTVNEPWCTAMLGHASGVHAPGIVDAGAAVAASHHVLLAHGVGVEALRSSIGDPGSAEISISLNPYPVLPVGDRELDLDAARRVDGVANRLWYDALLLGRYPDDVLDDFAAVSDLSHIRDGDLTIISTPIDALGINYYRRHHVRHRGDASARPPECTWPGSPDVETVDPPTALTASGWAIEPDGLHETLLDVQARGAPPLYVHENGAAFADQVGPDGEVDDTDRVAFLDGHLRAVHRAIADGVDVRGYFVWSLLDNFEWAEGYRRRFGIVHVDFETQARTIKASGHWYAGVVARNAL